MIQCWEEGTGILPKPVKKTIKQRIIPKCKDDLKKEAVYECFFEPTENCIGGKLASNQGD